MTDSIGRLPMGRLPMGRSKVTGKKRIQKAIQRMEHWRNKARINLLQQRRRYKRKVEDHKALMETRKADRLPNLNTTSVTIGHGDGQESQRYGATYSTIPLRPKYSRVKPKERLYGNKLKILEKRGDAND